MKNIFKIYRLPRNLGMFLIRVYQRSFSFDHGPLKVFFPNGYCRFYPTCSQFTYESVRKYGLVPGSILGLVRIIRCNPFSRPGIYNVPESFSFKRIIINETKLK